MLIYCCNDNSADYENCAQYTVDDVLLLIEDSPKDDCDNDRCLLQKGHTENGAVRVLICDKQRPVRYYKQEAKCPNYGGFYIRFEIDPLAFGNEINSVEGDKIKHIPKLHLR